MIRRITKRDVESIFRIMKTNMQPYYEARGEKWNEDNIRRYFLGMNNVVIEDEGEVRAFSFYETTQEGAHIHTFQVVHNRQNGWMGAKLFRWYLALAEQHGYSELTCSVFDSNPAQAMYLKLGFEETARHNGVVRLSLPLTKDRGPILPFALARRRKPARLNAHLGSKE